MKKETLFDIEDLEMLASERSYERGEEYFISGVVKNVKRVENHFEAKVLGSSVYHTTLDIDDDELDFDCTCPYNYEGICKHCVALGLAILDNNYTEVNEIQTGLTKHSPQKFEECYSETDTQQKLSFLKQLLDKDTDLQSQFVAFIESRSGKLDEVTGIDIEEIADDFGSDLEFLDFDGAIEESYQYNNHYDEGEEESAYELVEEVISTYSKRATDFLKKGNLLDAFRIILGMYEGCQELEEPNCQYEIFYDGYSYYVLSEVKSTLNIFAKELEIVVKSDESIIQLIDLFSDRYNLHNIETEEGEAEIDEAVTSYNAKYFEAFFLSLITNNNTAEYLKNIINENNLNKRDTAFILLEIAEKNKDEKSWIEISEKYAEVEYKIAQNLLNKYKEQKQTNDFNRIAKLAYTKWNAEFDQYLIDNLDRTEQKELFVEVFTNLVSRQCNIKRYKELREYISETQKNKLINEQNKSYNELFYIQLLDVEKRYKEILSFNQKNPDRHEIHKLISPIVNVYPNESFEMLKNHCDKELKSLQRNRKTYQYMVKQMKEMRKIEAKQTECRLYFQSLYANRLPALKDEMRKAKLV